MSAPNLSTYRIGNLTHADAAWYLLAARHAAERRYPAGFPNGIAPLFERAEKSVEAVLYDLDFLSAMLCCEGTDGVEGPPLRDLGEDDRGQEGDDEGENWHSKR